VSGSSDTLARSGGTQALRLLLVVHILAVVVMILGATMVLPFAVSLIMADGASTGYGGSIALTLAVGGVVYATTRRAVRGRELQVRDGFLLVALVWTVLPAFATLPLLTHIDGLSFTDAYFETVSGLTASGATVLSGLDALPPSINFWRCLLVWIGGLGVVVLAVAILPLLGVGGSQLFRAETPGPMKDSKLTPRIAQTAKGLWLVYVGLTAACALAYRAAGMGWFDALIHAFSTMALGGFAGYDASFAHFDSVAIEVVAIVFMLLAGINFATHFVFARSGDLRAYRRDPEALVFVALLVASSIGIAAYLWLVGTYASFATALRFASFNVVSVATTTGFANTDFGLWPIFVPVFMIFLASFASCSGSTGGGIKLVRALLLWKQSTRELKRILHPRAYIPVKLGGQLVDGNVMFAVLGFAMLYGSTIAIATLAMLASGCDVITAFTAVMASINNMGPGLGEVGPSTTYAGLTDFQTWVCTSAMLLGRLELFTLIVVLTPAFWRQ
jgi:trk system potassium uptake protein